MKKDKQNLKIFIGIAIVLAVILIIWILLVVIKVPYDTTEFYSEQEPYETTESYWEKEPYTVSYRECTKHSWWTGKCIEYDTFYKTEYRNVKKSRTIIKYRTVQKSRTVTRYCNLWKRFGGMC